MPNYHTNALNEALRRLSDSPFLPAAVRYLTENSAAIDAELGETVLAEIPAQRLVLHLAGVELQQLLPAWISEFFVVDEKIGGSLVATLRAYANANMKVLQAAEKLSVHPDTIYFRFEKILDITGLHAKSFHASTELLILADCRRRSTVDTLADRPAAVPRRI